VTHLQALYTRVVSKQETSCVNGPVVVSKQRLNVLR